MRTWGCCVVNRKQCQWGRACSTSKNLICWSSAPVGWVKLLEDLQLWSGLLKRRCLCIYVKLKAGVRTALWEVHLCPAVLQYLLGNQCRTEELHQSVGCAVGGCLWPLLSVSHSGYICGCSQRKEDVVMVSVSVCSRRNSSSLAAQRIADCRWPQW